MKNTILCLLLIMALSGCVQDNGNNTEITVSRVIDGDTFVLNSGDTVRLICINTPEKGDFYADEATEYLKGLVLGKNVLLEKDVSETDRYGRLLRYVYAGNISVNEILVRKGYASVYRYPPDTKYCDVFEASESEAKENGFGIWSQKNETENKIISDAGMKYICSYNAYNCDDFISQEEAQSVFEACGGVSNDIHGLDKDHDGVVCEGL